MVKINNGLSIFKKVKFSSLLELNLEAMYKYKDRVLYNMLILKMKGKF